MALSLVATGLLALTASALALTGDISQPPGRGGCISQTGAGACADGHALRGPNSVAVSPDGENVYVASKDAVVRLNRNTRTGAITQPPGRGGCISQTGAGSCGDGHGLKGPGSVAVSPDGKSVYAVSGFDTGSDAVVRLKRNRTTGAITQPPGRGGCISQTGRGPCADGHALSGPSSVAVSANGKSVYVASTLSDAVVRLKRNRSTGAIAQPSGRAGCVSETGAGPCANGHALDGPFGVAVTGKSVYAASGGGFGAVVRLKRNTTTGAITQPAGRAGCLSETQAGQPHCVDGHGMSGADAVTVSPDGKNVYVASGFGIASHAVARLNRSTATGAITQPAGNAGCISGRASEPCATGHALQRPQGLVVSPDGRNIYVASAEPAAVARLNRNTATGSIAQPAGSAGCACGAHALTSPSSVAVSPDGESVYAAAGGSDAVVRLNRVSGAH
jgi:DNA-binding beta-propeller fold protein YncE